MTVTTLDKRQVRAAFDRAASSYDEVALLQRMIADRLIERLDLVKLEPKRILDAGTGTGYCLPLLRRRYRADVVALDLAEGMVRAARHQGRWWTRRSLPVCADIERMPLVSAGVDLIISNLTLQWCHPDTTFREFARVLAPGGLLMFTTFGPDTLKEVRAAWAGVDEQPHVHDFVDMHDLGDVLVRSGFAEPVLDVERLTVSYGSPRALVRDLKALGAHNARLGRFPGLTGKHRFRRFEERLATGAFEGRIPVSFEVVYGHAWGAIRRPADDALRPVRWLGRGS